MLDKITIILALPKVIPYKKTATTSSIIKNKSHDGDVQFILPKLAPTTPKDASPLPANS